MSDLTPLVAKFTPGRDDSHQRTPAAGVACGELTPLRFAGDGLLSPEGAWSRLSAVHRTRDAQEASGTAQALHDALLQATVECLQEEEAEDMAAEGICQPVQCPKTINPCRGPCTCPEDDEDILPDLGPPEVSDDDEWDEPLTGSSPGYTDAPSPVAAAGAASQGGAASTTNDGATPAAKGAPRRRKSGCASKDYESEAARQLVCHCRASAARGQTSCTLSFAPLDRINLLKQVRGLDFDRPRTKRDQLKEVHRQVWELRVPNKGRDAARYKWNVTEWKLCGVVVCKKAYAFLTGATSRQVRDAISLVRVDTSPADFEGKAAAQARVNRSIRVDMRTPEAEFAITWWVNHVKLHDWLPNELCVQYRGPRWTQVYHKQYEPLATAQGMALHYKQWKFYQFEAMKRIADDHYNDFLVAGKEKSVVRLTRSARHSKFPECTSCSELRRAYVDAAKKAVTAPNIVERAWQEYHEHQIKWQADRAKSWSLRMECCNFEHPARYQCDDKCGSFWQKLPVSVGGRDTKENATAAYHFAVHANVLCGASGVNRFTFVPKNIKTGSNFGLSNLLMVLVAARESGGLPSHVRHLYRHTDGGPDNVAWTTHFFHWLLVYLGVFDEITWFRFKAGHSHTEIADRLFSVIKQYFEADNTAARVDPVGSFFELQHILTKAFAKSAEGSLFHFHFCSWDIEQWLKDIGGFSEEYGGYSEDLVFNYKYVPSLYRHGCVKVRHKHAVAWTGSSTDAEWAPVEEKTRSIPSPDGDGLCDQKYNATMPNGLLFVTHPPDLTVECKREAYSEKAEFVPTDSIRKILSKRADDLAPADKAHWQALQQVHELCAQASTTIPNMPFNVEAGGRTFTFDGLPRPLVPLLKKLMIFERPLLGKEPFEHPPPDSWDKMHAQMQSGGCSPRP